MIFKSFESTDIVSGKIQPVSIGVWENGVSEHTSFYTSSVQTQTGSVTDLRSGLYFFDVYDKDPATDVTADVYFSVTYGHYAGAGSSTTDTLSYKLYPTKVIYNQYKNILLTPNDDKFTFGGTTNSDDIYVLSFSPLKVKDKLDQGLFQVNLSGSNGLFKFIDDSSINTNTYLAGNKVFNIVSGSIESGVASVYGATSYGLMYPDIGVAIFHPTGVAALVGGELTPAGDGGVYAMNHSKFFNAVSLGGSIRARATEYVPSRHYFARVKNQEFNYTNNPTFITSSMDPTVNGKLRFDDFIADPRTYITSVGLYNENNDLVAVAKLSQPLKKDFSSECLIRVRLDF